MARAPEVGDCVAVPVAVVGSTDDEPVAVVALDTGALAAATIEAAISASAYVGPMS